MTLGLPPEAHGLGFCDNPKLHYVVATFFRGIRIQRRGVVIRLIQACAALGTLPTVLRASPRRSRGVPPRLQYCRIAGSHHYDCHTILPRLRIGDYD